MDLFIIPALRENDQPKRVDRVTASVMIGALCGFCVALAFTVFDVMKDTDFLLGEREYSQMGGTLTRLGARDVTLEFALIR